MELKACREILEKDFEQRLKFIRKQAGNSLQDDELHNLLHSAVQFGLTDLFEKQIDHGLANINFRKPNGLALIHTAVSCNQLEIVKILIKHGANLNFQAQNWGVVPMTLQESPLHLATYFGFNEIAQLLLENGA